MKVGIIADTHGDLDAWLHILDVHFSQADIIIHAGDILYGADITTARLFNESLRNLKIPLLAAEGNCDRFSGTVRPQLSLFSPFGKVTVNGHTIVFMHGDSYTTPLAKQLCAQDNGADIIVSGHTHEYSFYRNNGVTFINPGSPAKPRGKDPVPTIMVLNDHKVDLINTSEDTIIKSFYLE